MHDHEETTPTKSAFGTFVLLVSIPVLGIAAFAASTGLKDSFPQEVANTLRIISGLLVLALILIIAVTLWLTKRIESVGRKALEQHKQVAFDAASARQRHESIVASIDGIVWEARFTAEGSQFLYVSQRAETLLGYPIERWLREPGFWEKIIHPDDRPDTISYCARQTGFYQDHNFEYRVIAKDGTTVWLHDFVTVTPNITPPLLRGVMVDISARKNSEIALHAERERSSAFLLAIPDILIIMNSDGIYLDCQANDETLLPSRRSEIVGRYCSRILPPDLSHQLMIAVRDVTQSREPRSFSHEMATLGGQRFFEVRMVPYAQSQVFCIMRDVTELRRAHTEHERLNEKLRETQKLESLGVLAGGIAHDFNNLLTSILGNASLAQLDLPEKSPAAASLAHIEEAAHRAADLCRQMLTYSGRGRFMIIPTNLSDLVEESKPLLNVSTRKTVPIEYRLAQNLPTVDADVTQLRQLLLNLVINAAEAATKPGAAIAVSTGTFKPDQTWLAAAAHYDGTPLDKCVYLQVTDTGCGMSQDTVSKIFEPFFSTKFTGRGLGLSASLGIVRGHNGAIRVDSKPGVGSTFTVLFPVRQTYEPLATPDDSLGERIEETALRGDILVVDDEDSVRMVACRSLQSVGLETTEAKNGREAIEAFKAAPKGTFRAVLLDLTMPEMSGLHALKKILEIAPETPAVIMSGFDDSDTIAQIPTSPRITFLSKPFAPTDVIQKITQVTRNPTPRKTSQNSAYSNPQKF